MKLFRKRSRNTAEAKFEFALTVVKIFGPGLLDIHRDIKVEWGLDNAKPVSSPALSETGSQCKFVEKNSEGATDEERYRLSQTGKVICEISFVSQPPTLKLTTQMTADVVRIVPKQTIITLKLKSGPLVHFALPLEDYCGSERVESTLTLQAPVSDIELECQISGVCLDAKSAHYFSFDDRPQEPQTPTSGSSLSVPSSTAESAKSEPAKDNQAGATKPSQTAEEMAKSMSEMSIEDKPAPPAEKPAEPKPEPPKEPKATEAKVEPHAETKPSEAEKSAEPKPAETEAAKPISSETKPSEAEKPAEPKPTGTEAAKPIPAETKPSESEPIKPPAETKPAETEAAKPSSAETKPSEGAKPAEATQAVEKPEETKPVHKDSQSSQDAAPPAAKPEGEVTEKKPEEPAPTAQQSVQDKIKKMHGVPMMGLPGMAGGLPPKLRPKEEAPKEPSAETGGQAGDAKPAEPKQEETAPTAQQTVQDKIKKMHGVPMMGLPGMGGGMPPKLRPKEDHSKEPAKEPAKEPTKEPEPTPAAEPTTPTSTRPAADSNAKPIDDLEVPITITSETKRLSVQDRISQMKGVALPGIPMPGLQNRPKSISPSAFTSNDGANRASVKDLRNSLFGAGGIPVMGVRPQPTQPPPEEEDQFVDDDTVEDTLSPVRVSGAKGRRRPTRKTDLDSISDEL
eukprot:c7961_g1_i2.p1 GENE.c7961_g1_i2~~c7961_g1_i2.p1  ORF type:complete len:681 (+),score=127.97 c7961_g1_i2:46-2088(+)